MHIIQPMPNTQCMLMLMCVSGNEHARPASLWHWSFYLKHSTLNRSCWVVVSSYLSTSAACLSVCFWLWLDFDLASAFVLVTRCPVVAGLDHPKYDSSLCTCKFLWLPYIPTSCAELVQASSEAEQLPGCILISCCVWTYCMYLSSYYNLPPTAEGAGQEV